MASPHYDAPQLNGLGGVVAESGGKQLSALGSRIVQAYGHPIRARALLILGARVASPKQIAEEIEEPIGKVSYHIRELRDAGLIELVETDGSRGGVQHFYRATRQAVVDTDGMKLQSDTERAASSSALLNQMINSRPEHVMVRHHALLDQKGWEQLGELHMEALWKAFAIHREALARLEESEEEPIPAALHWLFFEMPSLEWLDGAEASLPDSSRSEGRRVDDGDPS
jgi:DNA-binding transcriptional ArsR family regulator